MPRWVFRYVGNKAFDFSCKKMDFCPKLAFLLILGQALLAHLVPCRWVGWWLVIKTNSLFTLAVNVRYQKVLCKDWKVSGCCPAGVWCNRWTFCTVVQHTAPGLQILPSLVLPSSAFDGTSFLSTETNGQLLVHCIGSAEGRASSNLHSRFLLLRGLSSQPWKIYAGWWWSQLGDTLTRHQFLLWQSFDKTFTSKLSLCSFAALTYFGQWLLNKRRHEKNHKHKESKLRLNTTLFLLSRLRLTKAGRSNNYSAQTSGFFRCPLIFIFSLHHQPH